ncbi:hypothetical protein ABGB12_11245 [Actinocorallia sp. B10E7]|uniref:hypothetical protein n=1 Tax=Actinocorallia sp. B10E7 TaxID=3153558 RepID=UPI00325DDCAE
MPALTSAEREFVDHYLAVVDLLGRINPANAEATYGALRAAQALVGEAGRLRDALETMLERGEKEVFGDALIQVIRELDGQRRTERLALPDEHPSSG